ncbi:MAG: 50S ribosomal protein L9 [Acidobacteria bacterium]|nr:MAG: 50S ribosomal protein L9 [Acidobacteriota bacterium]
MKLILLEDVDKLGKRGAVVTVKDGYGRNFLLPRKLATHATEGNMKQVAVENKKVELKEAKDEKDASVVKSEIENISLTIPVKAGESDVLFGSVTSSDVAAALEKKGVTVDKRRIELEPIKRLGEYQVPIKLHKNVTAEIKVSVIKE